MSLSSTPAAAATPAPVAAASPAPPPPSAGKICFNVNCNERIPEAPPPTRRRGWRLRSGDIADLCERCSVAYEQGNFCETFHSGSDGWRKCVSCGKQVHCGCIVSIATFVLLDAGGIECIACARKRFKVPNYVWQSAYPFPFGSERPKDMSAKNLNQLSASNPVPGHWRQATSMWNTSVQSELQQRLSYEFDRPNGTDRLISGQRLAAQSQNNKKVEDIPDRLTSHPNRAHLDRLSNGNSAFGSSSAVNELHREGHLEGLQDSSNLIVDADPTARREVPMRTSAGINFGPLSNASVNKSAAIVKDDPQLPLINLAAPSPPLDDTNDPARVSSAQSHRQAHASHLTKQNFPKALSAADSSCEAQNQLCNGRPRGECRGRNQLLPRYWPRITDQEIQQISGEYPLYHSLVCQIKLYNEIVFFSVLLLTWDVTAALENKVCILKFIFLTSLRPYDKNVLYKLTYLSSNSVITPLFEKTLSASDAGRIGRLVLPKKCAEAYFPPISQPEGLPLKVQDAKGQEWVFQFRFWPNNNSRMYVLEGVTPCIQSMKLQAGDTVTFSQMEPEGKLIMGFRKASNVSTEQDVQAVKPGNGYPATKEVSKKNSNHSEGISSLHSRAFKSNLESANASDPSNQAIWSKDDRSGFIQKERTGSKSGMLPSKRKSSTLGPKNKRLRIENEDSIELKLTWEEAQELLRPPPNHKPSIFLIEGHEFEEYEEAPVLGKPTIVTTNQAGEKNQWAQCEDCSKWRKLPVDALLPPRWTCSDNLWDSQRSSCSSAQEITTQQLADLLPYNNASDGLDTLANLAILGEGESLPPSEPTTKHPRHRPGCTCIVCIQPPSGKGPKHKQTCQCNVCLTVKRRFQTLMLRKEKRQSEKDAEKAGNARKKQQETQMPEVLSQRAVDPPLTSNVVCCEAEKTAVLREGFEDDCDRKQASPSPIKTQIDLNIQPDRDEEPSPVSDAGNLLRLLQDAAA